MKRANFIAGGALALLMSTGVNATVIEFSSNVAGNSTDFINSVNSFGASLNSNVNFDDAAVGSWNSNFYSSSEGVTVTSTDPSAEIRFGAGPGQSNSSSSPTSTGEGLHASSNYLFDSSQSSVLTIDFDAGVFGAGIFIIDMFNPSSFNEDIVLSAFDGVGGSGSLLGSVTSPGFNFQRNYEFFLGIASTDSDIRSIVLTDTNGGAGDSFGYDQVLFATAGTTDVPEPSALALMGLGLAGISFTRRKKNAK